MERQPSELAVTVYEQVLEQFGEPDVRMDIEPGDALEARFDVFAWHPTPTVPLTTFATVGGCDRDLPGVEHRAELTFARRGDLADREVESIASFLAGIFRLPADRGIPLDWWHLYPGLDEIPTYPGCDAVLMHPAFRRGGWDHIHVGPIEVRMLNVVALTGDEARAIREEGLPPVMERLYELGQGLFAPRD